MCWSIYSICHLLCCHVVVCHLQESEMVKDLDAQGVWIHRVPTRIEIWRGYRSSIGVLYMTPPSCASMKAGTRMTLKFHVLCNSICGGGGDSMCGGGGKSSRYTVVSRVSTHGKHPWVLYHNSLFFTTLGAYPVYWALTMYQIMHKISGWSQRMITIRSRSPLASAPVSHFRRGSCSFVKHESF